MDISNSRILVIDNGSYECRVGWNTESAPSLKFRNVLTKPRKDRKKEANSTPEIPGIVEIQVGNDITNIEAVRMQLKSPYDRNVITNWNNQEQIFDYVFSNIGFDGESSINNPIVLTEALANPNYCRQQMSELLFECYGVPAVNYGIDALFSWQHHNRERIKDALIISFGYSTTHVIPVLDGILQLQKVRRLNVGGYHIITFLFRLMQMKYPMHINSITISRIESLVQQECRIAVDYQEELDKWAQMDYYEQNVLKIQLPYNAVTTSNAAMTAEQKQERRRELANRLIEMKTKREREQLQADEQQLELLCNIRHFYEQNKVHKFERALQQQQISNLEELDDIIKTLHKNIERYKSRTSGSQGKPSRLQSQQEKIAKAPADVPQEEWLNEVREKREDILKRRQERHAQRQEQAKRHTHAAQERMRIISTLARNEKRRKGNEEDDGFGMNDDDWDVYKRINRYNDDSDSEAEQEKLLEYEKILSHYEPNFDERTTSDAVTAENYQLHFGLEAIRGPELLFQPSMIGSSEAGLPELIDFVLKLFKGDEQQRMVEHIFITGGCAQFRGLKERLNKELRALRPFQSTFAIYESDEAMLSAWLGACQFARTENCRNTMTTRAEYDEHGGEYFKEHRASNFYYPTPDE